MKETKQKQKKNKFLVCGGGGGGELEQDFQTVMMVTRSTSSPPSLMGMLVHHRVFSLWIAVADLYMRVEKYYDIKGHA